MLSNMLTDLNCWALETIHLLHYYPTFRGYLLYHLCRLCFMHRISLFKRLGGEVYSGHSCRRDTPWFFTKLLDHIILAVLYLSGLDVDGTFILHLVSSLPLKRLKQLSCLCRNESMVTLATPPELEPSVDCKRSKHWQSDIQEVVNRISAGSGQGETLKR